MIILYIHGLVSSETLPLTAGRNQYRNPQEQEILEHMALKGWLLKSLSSGFGKSVEEEVERLSEQMGLEDTKETVPPKQNRVMFL